MNSTTVIVIGIAMGLAGCGRAETPLPRAAGDDGFNDPAPPEVRSLEPMDAPLAGAYPELTTHATPGPLPENAITEDWPCFLGPTHDGHSREDGLEPDWSSHPPRLLWTMQRGQGYACPAVAGGRLVYTHRVGGTVHIDCLEAETGRRYWRHSYDCDYRGDYFSDNGPRSTPVIDGQRVYVHGVKGKLHCLELTTGRVIWQRDISGEFGIGDQFFGVVATPIVHGDLLIQNIGAPGGPSVAAFDKRTGRLVWGTGSTWGPGCASPVITEVHNSPTLFVLCGGKSRPATGGLMILEPDTGALRFEYPFRSRTVESVNGATPVVGDDTVFITASYNTGTAAVRLEPDGGAAPLWKTRRVGMQFSNPVYWGDHLWAIDGRSDRLGAVLCLDPATGDEVSRTDLVWDETLVYRGQEKTLQQSIGEGSLLVVNGRGLCLGDNGHLLWLDLDPVGVKVQGRVSLFRANESWTPPVLSQGLLYVCQNKRERFGATPSPPRLLCFDLRRVAE